jgi:hypothetical protein
MACLTVAEAVVGLVLHSFKGRWLDDVDFAEHFSIAEPFCPKRMRVHE